MEADLTQLTTVNSDPSDPQGQDRRLFLIESNIEHIEKAYLAAIKRGIVEPMVLALDANDPDAKNFAKALCPKQESYIEYMKAEITKDGNIPTLWISESRQNVYKALQVFQEIIHKGNRRNPAISKTVEAVKDPPTIAGSFWVLAMSRGKLLAAMPIPE
jgi:hypothetical protein